MIIVYFILKEADEVFRDEEDDDVKRQSITTGCVRLEGNAIIIMMHSSCCSLETYVT